MRPARVFASSLSGTSRAVISDALILVRRPRFFQVQRAQEGVKLLAPDQAVLPGTFTGDADHLVRLGDDGQQHVTDRTILLLQAQLESSALPIAEGLDPPLLVLCGNGFAVG